MIWPAVDRRSPSMDVLTPIGSRLQDSGRNSCPVSSSTRSKSLVRSNPVVLAALAAVALAHGCANSKVSDRYQESLRRSARMRRTLARLPVAVAEAPQTEIERLANRSLAAALASHGLPQLGAAPFVLVRDDEFRAERILPRDGSAKFAIITSSQLRDLIADYGDVVLLVVSVILEGRQSAVVPVYVSWGSDKTCSSGVTYYYERGSSDWILREVSGSSGCEE
jgi:hypothetical protein